MGGRDLLEEGQILEITQASKVCLSNLSHQSAAFLSWQGLQKETRGEGGVSVAAHSVNTEGEWEDSKTMVLMSLAC